MSNDELAKRIEELEAKLAATQAELVAVKAKVDPPPPLPPEKPRYYQKYDPTEGFRMPASAAKAMAAVVPDMKPRGGFDAHAHSQTKAPFDVGGFGPKASGPTDAKPRGTGWVKPRPLEGMVTEEKMKRWSK